MPFERGVKYYTKAVGMIEVGFPEDKTVCRWCKYCRSEQGLERSRCLITDEYILNPKAQVGHDCPLEIVDILAEQAESEGVNE